MERPSPDDLFFMLTDLLGDGPATPGSSAGSDSAGARSAKRPRSDEDESTAPTGDAKRRNHNAAEKRRADKLNQAIERIRALLTAHGYSKQRSKAAVLDDALQVLSTLMEQRNAPKALPAPDTLPPAQLGPVAEPTTDFRSVFTHGSVPMLLVDLSTRLLDCNNLFSAMAGIPRSEARQFTVPQLTHPEDISATFGAIAQLLQSHSMSAVTMTKRCRMADGMRMVRASISVVYDEHGAPKYFQSCFLPVISVDPAAAAAAATAAAAAAAATTAAAAAFLPALGDDALRLQAETLPAAHAVPAAHTIPAAHLAPRDLATAPSASSVGTTPTAFAAAVAAAGSVADPHAAGDAEEFHRDMFAPREADVASFSKEAMPTIMLTTQPSPAAWQPTPATEADSAAPAAAGDMQPFHTASASADFDDTFLDGPGELDDLDALFLGQ